MSELLKITESGITVSTLETFATALSYKRLQKHLAMKISRAIALYSLKILLEETEGIISALDAIGSFGLAGMQWVKNLRKVCHVDINVGCGLKQSVGAVLEENSCCFEKVEVLCEDPNVLMHSKKFQYIYIESTSTAVTYFDAAMRSINHNGILCVTCSDIATLQNKCPETAKRLYNANLLRTEYSNELAIRVIVLNLARAAGRWGKGIKVEMSTFANDAITLVCRVLRGSKYACDSLEALCLLAHCQQCQAREFVSEKKYALHTFSSIPFCRCGDDKVGSPIALLGPMWSKGIFDQDFMKKMLSVDMNCDLPKETKKLFELIFVETICCSHDEMEQLMVNRSLPPKTTLTNTEKIEPPSKKQKMTAGCCDNEKDVQEQLHPTSCAKEIPPFYFDIQQHTAKGSNPPKLALVISKLRECGFYASKTHFGPRCVRTSASLKEFSSLLVNMWKESTEK